jgi:hypothetical protein
MCKLTVTVWASMLVWSSAVFAQQPTKQDQAFVVASVASVAVLAKCNGFEASTNSVVKLGDRMGVDAERLSNAITQAIRVGSDLDYDRSQLVPWVTRLMIETANGFDSELSANKAKFCKQWSDTLVKIGMIQKKAQ